MIDYEEIFNMSYWRTTQNVVDGVSFVEHFMNSLLDASEEIRGFFVHSDGEAFSQGLILALVHLAGYFPDHIPDRVLEGIAVRHNRHGRAIKPHLYDIFLDCMLETVVLYDPEYEEHVGEAWRHVLSPGLEYIKSQY